MNKFRRSLQTLLARMHRALTPPPSRPDPTISLNATLTDPYEAAQRRAYVERCHELEEARSLSGAGPWLSAPSRQHYAETGKALSVRESTPMMAVGAYGDIELALSNVEWRREINLSWLEFSRWGVQNIILITRLYYIKNPLMRRIIDVCAAYVFARGVDVSSPDEAANEVLTDFFARNRSVLGQLALVDLERKKDQDGNLFWVFFTDQASGAVTVRMIDATEMQDIVTNPDDACEPWYYHRIWTQQQFNPQTGRVESVTAERWYPAIHFEPTDRPESFNGIPIAWDSPVYHRKCGTVGQWRFGCPRVYPAIDWAKQGRAYLENCATITNSLAQIAMTITTKGGQQALQGIKNQLQTTVNSTGSSLWDTNPTAVNASIFASGPGTELAAFRTRGAGADPEEVRQFKLMVCMVKGVPETFLGDVSTGNLATATSLDRPTETAFLELQEAWIEDLGVISQYVLEKNAAASGGSLYEAATRAGRRPPSIRMMERRRDKFGRSHYFPMAEEQRAERNIVEVRVEFPAIREGDIPQLVTATCSAMEAGVDKKEGVRKLGDLLGIDNNDELVEEQFPEESYQRDQTLEPETVEDVPGEPSTAEDEMLEAADRLLAAANRL